MGGGDYVTRRELNMVKESIERKIDTVHAEIKHEIYEGNHSFLMQIQLQEEKRRHDSKSTIRWIIGTRIAIAVIIVAALAYF